MELFSPTSPLCRKRSQGYLTNYTAIQEFDNPTLHSNIPASTSTTISATPSPNLCSTSFEAFLKQYFGVESGIFNHSGDNVTIFLISLSFTIVILSDDLIFYLISDRSYLVVILSIDLICDKTYLVLSDHAVTSCPTCVYHVFHCIYTFTFLVAIP